MIYVALIILLLVIALLIYSLGFGPRLPREIDAIIDRVRRSPLPELVTGHTGFARSGELNIWYEHIVPEGASKGVVLLEMAMGGNALDWPPAFVRVLVDAGWEVIRYDHRGTGLSDRVAGRSPYTISDMAGDALAVLDAAGVQNVHVIGLSMGGMIAQEIAVRRPVLSLTLLSTSGYVGDPALPGPSSRYFLMTLVKGLPLLKYRLRGGEANLVKERIAKIIVGTGVESLNIQETAETVLYDLRKRRGVSIEGASQHWTSVTVSGSRYDKLKTITAPTLVIHGTADPLIPIEHGRKLVDIISNAQGMWLEGVGHVFPYPDMERVNRRILAHLDQSGTASGLFFSSRCD